MDKLIYNGWLKLYKREVKGREFEILKNYDGVAVIIQNSDNDIILVKQFRPSVMKETYEIPAGCLDIPGESSEDCAVREIFEETGIVINKEKLRLVTSYKPVLGFSTSNMVIYQTRVDKADLKSNKIDDLDVSSANWVSFLELGELVREGTIMDGKTLISYYYLLSNSVKL